MKNLQVTINFRDKTSQTIQKNVMIGEKVDLNHLHQSIMTIQRETNEILTTLVENEKQTSVSGGKTVNNSQSSDDDNSNDDDVDGENGVEPPPKLQKR